MVTSSHRDASNSRAAERRLAFGRQRLVWENTRFRVFSNELLEDGVVRVPDYLVVQPREANAGMVTGVAVLPVVKGRFGLLKVYRPALAASGWEVPRGFVGEGEAEPLAVLRELEEETGLVCSLESLHSLGLLAPDGGVLAGKIHLFVAEDCHPARPFDGEEVGHEMFQLFTPRETAELVRLSLIQDPCTLVAYCKYTSALF